MSMEFHQLRYFVAVAESGSFSRAAQQCHVAQPSLSQQIKRLETSLETTLIDRLGRRIALTAAGEALLPRARRILAEVREVSDLVAGGRAASPSLSVGAIPTIAPFLLPEAIKRFRRRFRDCLLTVREDLTERLVDALIDCELDCAITSTPIEHELIETEVIGRERLLVAAPRDLNLAAQRLTVTALRDQPAVVLHEMHCLGQQIQEFCAARRLTRRIVCRTTQLATVLEMVALGLGVSIVPEMCARSDHGGARRYIEFARGGPVRELAVAWRRGRSRSGETCALVEEVQRVINGLCRPVSARDARRRSGGGLQ